MREKEEQVMQELLLIDNVFGMIFEHSKNEVKSYISIEQVIAQCIQFWSVGIIKDMDTLRTVIKLMLPLELGEKYYEILRAKGKI